MKEAVSCCDVVIEIFLRPTDGRPRVLFVVPPALTDVTKTAWCRATAADEADLIDGDSVCVCVCVCVRACAFCSVLSQFD